MHLPHGFLVCALLWAALYGESVEYRLGGPRQPIVQIRESVDLFEVVVSMVAVHAFDDATNSRLNRAKAKAYALEALGRHLGNKPPLALSVRQMATTSAVRAEGTFRSSYEIGRKDIQVSPPRTAATADERNGDRTEQLPAEPIRTSDVASSKLFTAVDDYRDTLRHLQLACLKEIPAKHLTDEEFGDAIAAAEETAVDCFDQLRRDIEQDKLLLRLEVESLLLAIKSAESAYIERLRKEVDARQKNERTTK